MMVPVMAMVPVMTMAMPVTQVDRHARAMVAMTMHVLVAMISASLAVHLLHGVFCRSVVHRKWSSVGTGAGTQGQRGGEKGCR